MRLTRWLEELRHDVTFAVRQLRRAPAFMIVAAITLALGIGANGAIFALVDAALLRPLPLPDPERLVVAWDGSDAAPRGPVSPLDMLDWNDRSRTFERLAGFVPGVGSMVMAGEHGTEGVPRQWVTSGVFDVLGVRPVVGRTFLPSDDTQQVSAVVLSEGFWRTRFGADPAVIGQQIRFDGMPFTVVGVVPQHAQLIGTASIWALVQLRRDIVSTPGAPSADALRATRILRVVGRIKPDTNVESAQADIDGVAVDLAREFPRTNKGRRVLLEPLRDVLIGGDLRLTSLLFLGVVGFVLLICCANVANLLLARAVGREKELAIRAALGAGRRRIVCQLLTESLVLASVGGALGIGIGAVILSVAPSMIPAGLLTAAVAPTFDVRVIAFCVVTTGFVGLLFGIAPAWHARALALTDVSTAGTRAVTPYGGALRSVLVVGEVAAAVLLLFGAGLLLRTLMALDGTPRGYRATDVLAVLVDPLGGQYPKPQLLLQFFGAVEREVSRIPDVRRVAWASTLPLGESTLRPIPFEIVGEAPLAENERPAGGYQIVSPSYFDTIDLPIVAGRGFTDADAADSTMVCMVNEAFVRRHLQGRSVVGARIMVRSPASNASVVREVVGVARQIKQRPDDRDDFVQVYVPLAQDPFDDMFLLARPQVSTAASLAPAVREAIARVDTAQLVTVGAMMTLDDIARDATARHRFRAWLVVAFAGLSLALAMVGVFGVIAYAVQQRVREFGIRIALGATTGALLGLVLGGAARLVGVGVFVGLGASALLAQSLSAFLYGVRPLDPMTFVAVVIALVLTATLATALPAMRATRVDPVAAFRAD